jgi:hypothetical protein
MKNVTRKSTYGSCRAAGLFVIYVLGFFIIASSMALFQPMADTPPLLANPPDEHARFLVPQYICEHGTLPTGYEEELRIPSYGFSYGIYNIFPYIVQGYVMRFVSLFTDSALLLLYAARGVNVFVGTLMAVLVYLLSSRLFADRRFSWLFCFAVMYLPESLFLHTYVNTDSMSLLSVTMIFYALTAAYTEGFRLKNLLWLSGGITLCALSYYNAYGWILMAILVFPAYFWDKENGRWLFRWKEMLKKGGLVSLLVIAGCGWWFLRSYLIHDGDILGLATREKMSVLYGIPSLNPANLVTFRDREYSIGEMLREKNFFEGAFNSFVAVFGSMTILGNIWIYRFYKVFIVGGLFALPLCATVKHLHYKYVQRQHISREKFDSQIQTVSLNRHSLSEHSVLQKRSVSWKRLYIQINLLICGILPLLLLIWYAYATDYQDQGRYLMPAVLLIMYWVIKGVERAAGWFASYPWLINLIMGILFAGIIASLLWMVYGIAFPIYLETGMIY